MSAKRKKRGRTKVANIDREPNGRKQRQLRPREDARMTAAIARMRHHGVKLEDALLGDAGTVQGRLWLSGAITYAEREAATQAYDRHAKMQRAIHAPDSLMTGGSGGGGDLVTDDYVDWATRACADWDVVRWWLVDKAAYVVFDVCILNQSNPSPIELPCLKRGLSYVAKRLGLDTGE